MPKIEQVRVKMKLIELKELYKKDIPLFYRQEFSGLVVLEDQNNKQVETKVEFIVERSATGETDIKVDLIEDVHFPVIPVIRSLKEHIRELDKKGQLP
jgi:hypothetical protein